MEGFIQDEWWIIWVDSYAIWIDQCTQYVYEDHEWSLQIFCRWIYNCVSWWYTHLQSAKGRTPQTLKVGLENVPIREYVSQFKEVFLYENKVDISSIFNFPGRSKNGSREGQGNCGMAFSRKKLLGEELSWFGKIQQKIYWKFEKHMCNHHGDHQEGLLDIFVD